MIKTLFLAVSLWRPYPEAVEQYDKTEKPMVIAISASWCAHCPGHHERLEALVAKEFSNDVILTELDYDKHRNLVDMMVSEHKLPQTVIYFRDKDRQLKMRILVGSATAKELRDFIAPTIPVKAKDSRVQK